MGLKAAIKGRIKEFRTNYAMLWQIIYGSICLISVFVAGVLGYVWIEGWDFFDAFYMVVITLSTVGFQEVNPLTTAGRLWTSILILSGVGSFFFLVGSFAQIMLDGRLAKFLGRRKVRKTISRMSGHFIVCGYGRIGSIVVKEILREGHPVVVIEQNPALIAHMEAEEILCLSADATSDQTLIEAGLPRARSLITALTQESANVYVSLVARQINPDIQIIARADDASHIPRLKLAGATRVVMPHVIGGMRMAQSVLRPAVTNFLDLAQSGDVDLQMEELVISPASELAGKDLAASRLRQRFDLIVIAVKKPTGQMRFNPGPHEIIEAGDMLLAVGKTSDLKKVEEVL